MDLITHCSIRQVSNSAHRYSEFLVALRVGIVGTSLIIQMFRKFCASRFARPASPQRAQRPLARTMKSGL